MTDRRKPGMTRVAGSRHLVAMLLGLSFLSACATDRDLSVPPHETPMATLPELTEAQANGLTALPWSLTSLESDGSIAFVTVPNGGCQEIKGVRFVVTETDVALTVLGTTRTGCESHTNATVAVRLPRPVSEVQLRR